ncbi:MAG: hypothetical protein ABIB43_02045 [archaeon]
MATPLTYIIAQEDQKEKKPLTYELTADDYKYMNKQFREPFAKSASLLLYLNDKKFEQAESKLEFTIDLLGQADYWSEGLEFIFEEPNMTSEQIKKIVGQYALDYYYQHKDSKFIKKIGEGVKELDNIDIKIDYKN